MNVDPVKPQVVYIVHMCRWGDQENHSYVLGVYSRLKKAIDDGISDSEHRASKYEPRIIMIEIDGVLGSSTYNTICKGLDEARLIQKELNDDNRRLND